MHNGLKDAESRKEVTFGGLCDTQPYFCVQNLQNSPLYGIGSEYSYWQKLPISCSQSSAKVV